MDEVEVWLPVVGYEGLYEVSDLGRVRRLPRINRQGGLLGGMVLKASNSRGYRVVALDAKSFGIHRLVCEAFHGPAPEGRTLARHLNDVKHDNRADNLAWGSQRENMADALRNGRFPKALLIECQRGHGFEEFNLTNQSKRNGNRTCRACVTATEWGKRNGHGPGSVEVLEYSWIKYLSYGGSR